MKLYSFASENLTNDWRRLGCPYSRACLLVGEKSEASTRYAAKEIANRHGLSI
jgi:hypothetical protein